MRTHGASLCRAGKAGAERGEAGSLMILGNAIDIHMFTQENNNLSIGKPLFSIVILLFYQNTNLTATVVFLLFVCLFVYGDKLILLSYICWAIKPHANEMIFFSSVAALIPH